MPSFILFPRDRRLVIAIVFPDLYHFPTKSLLGLTSATPDDVQRLELHLLSRLPREPIVLEVNTRCGPVVLARLSDPPSSASLNRSLSRLPPRNGTYRMDSVVRQISLLVKSFGTLVKVELSALGTVRYGFPKRRAGGFDDVFLMSVNEHRGFRQVSCISEG